MIVCVAAKQFGNWIWGNASIYNRFGFKQCAMRNTSAAGDAQECVCDDQGSSLSLFRRLMYQQLLCALTARSPLVSLTCCGCSDCALALRADGAKIFGFEALQCGDPGDSPPAPGQLGHAACAAQALH